MGAVTGKSFDYDAAILHGYVRYRIKNRSYPGIIEMQGQVVSGRLYHDIDDSSLIRLDKFEAVEYCRKMVEVNLDNEAKVPAYTYIIHPQHVNVLTDHDWDPDWFMRNHLHSYLNRLR